MVRTGVGDPDLASWPLPNSTAVALLKLETHRDGFPDCPGGDPRPRALVAAALGCFSAAVHVWTASGGTLSLPALLDQAMSAVDDRRPVSGPNTT